MTDKTERKDWDGVFPAGPLLRLPAESANILHIESVVVQSCPPEDLGEKALSRLRLLIDEIFSNICRHAYANASANSSANPEANRPAEAPERSVQGAPGEMAVHVEPYDSQRRMLSFWAVDWGAPFNPIDAIPPVPPISAELMPELQRPQKLGLYLMGQSCHSLEYKRAALSEPLGDGREANLLRVSLALN